MTHPRWVHCTHEKKWGTLYLIFFIYLIITVTHQLIIVEGLTIYHILCYLLINAIHRRASTNGVFSAVCMLPDVLT